MTEDVTKLPKWAQARIQKLEFDVEHYKKKAYQATVPDASDTVIAYAGPNGGHLNLPKGSTIRFYLSDKDEGHYTDVRVKQQHGGLFIDVNSGMHELIVKPRAANAIQMKTN